jgi:predicted nucleotidyltransferase
VSNLDKFTKAYAAYFGAYLVSSLIEKEMLDQIEKIILFGSVAKGTVTKESDVDVFIQTKNESKKLKTIISGIVESFYNSREAVLFRTKGVANRFNIIIGEIKKWKELYRDIAATGILLWGPYQAGRPPEAKHMAIFYWKSVGKNRGSFLNKLYGFKIGGRKHPGLLEKWGGKKIGKSSVMIPIYHKEELIALIKQHDVDAEVLDVFT